MFLGILPLQILTHLPGNVGISYTSHKLIFRVKIFATFSQHDLVTYRLIDLIANLCKNLQLMSY